jgi:hypothetical protein
MQKKSVVYSIDRKTGEQKKVSEKTGPKEKYEQEEISSDEFNDVSAAKAAAAAAKAAMKKKQQQSGR